MSHLMIMMLRMVRAGLLLAAGFVAAVLALETWRYTAMEQGPEFGFLVVLFGLLAGFLILARSIRRELAKSGS